MKFTFNASPNLRQKRTTKHIMFELTAALLVVYAFSLYFYYTRYNMDKMVQCLILMATSLVTALVTDTLWALFTKQKVVHFVVNSFSYVTAIILTLMCTVNVTPYALGIATFFAIFFGKLLFGGFGQNIFNPAAFGRGIIFLAFANATTDTLTAATATTQIADKYNWLPVDPAMFDKMMDGLGGLGRMFTGWYAGALGETSAALLLVLGVILAIRKVIDWRIPVIYLTSIFVFGALIGLVSGMSNWLPYALLHVLSGGVVFGAVFMLTDPVTSPTSMQGRCIFALGAAFLTMLIRVKSNYPEGVLFSILIMNMLTPMIEKAMDGNQLRVRKKAYAIFGGIAVFSIALMALVANVMEPAKEEEPVVKKEPIKVTLSDEYTNTLTASVATTTDNGDGTTTYHVIAQGYASVEGPKDPTYSHPAEPNEFDIVVKNDDQSIVSITPVVIKDTEYIGDKIKAESFLKQFEGVKLSEEFEMEVNDAVSGATFSSKSTLRAVIEVRKALGY